MDGSVGGTIVDLTASFQLTDKFKLGLNAFSQISVKGYTGAALYPAVDVTENLV
jgi:hypothetical protein